MRGRRVRWLLVLAAVVGVALFYRIWLDRRPFTDEGSVCTLAQGLVRGQALYRDLTNEKAPAQYALTGAFFAALGSDRSVLRLVPAIALLVTILLAGRLAASLAASRAAGAGAGALVLLLAPAYQAFNNVAETSLAPITMLCLSAMLAPPAWLDRWRRRFLGLGALLGIGLWFKQNFALGVVSVLAAPALRGRRAETSLGALLAAVLGLAAAFAHSGSALLEAVLGTPAGIVTGGTVYARAPTPFEAVLLAAHAALVITVCIFAVRTGSDDVRSLAVVAAGLTLAALPRMDVFRIWPAAAPLAVGITVAAVRAGAPRRRQALRAIAAAWGLTCTAGRRPWAAGGYGDLETIAGEVASVTAPGDTVWVGPCEPNIYCLSARAPASRFTFVLPWFPSPAGRTELIHDLERRVPMVLVDVGAMKGEWASDLRTLVPGIDALLGRRYERRGAVAGAVIYVAKVAPPRVTHPGPAGTAMDHRE